MLRGQHSHSFERSSSHYWQVGDEARTLSITLQVIITLPASPPHGFFTRSALQIFITPDRHIRVGWGGGTEFKPQALPLGNEGELITGGRGSLSPSPPRVRFGLTNSRDSVT